MMRGARRTINGIRHSSTSTNPLIFQANNSNCFRFGQISDESPVFSNLSLKIGDKAVAVLSTSTASPNKSNFISVLQSGVRFSPTSSVNYPIIATLPDFYRPAAQGGPRPLDVSDIIKLVSFKTRSSSAFSDPTARYYHIREEQKVTVRKGLLEQGFKPEDIEEKSKLLKLEPFLDLPLITLSNGQTRRARILQALLANCLLLILEEPFAGLDPDSRKLLTELLETLHKAQSPRIMLVLRSQDPIPSFVEEIILLAEDLGSIRSGSREEILAGKEYGAILAGIKNAKLKRESWKSNQPKPIIGKVLVEMKKVCVTYGGNRKVLVDVDWTIRAGERWNLAGHNGSGKSTLLAVLQGEHPASFNADLTLFGKPRTALATSQIAHQIGHVSPELNNSFPRLSGKEGMSIKSVVTTGFDAIFCYRPITPAQESAIQALLIDFDHPDFTMDFLENTEFQSITVSQQAVTLLLRSLVRKPPLLILDEPFNGMSGIDTEKAKSYLDFKLSNDQASIVISHFEDELPDSINRKLMLDQGIVIENVEI